MASSETEFDIERWFRRLISLPESRMCVVVASEALALATDTDVVRLFAQSLKRAARRRSGFDRVLDALCIAVGTPSLFAYERLRAAYEIALDSGLDDVAQLLLSSKTHRVAGGGELELDPLLAEMSLGHRKSLARTADRDRIARFVHDTDPTVINNLLMNPKLLESDVLRMVSKRPIGDGVLDIVARSRWFDRYLVRKAIVFNPYTPVDLALRTLRHLLDPDLREVAADANLHPLVRTAASSTRMIRREA